MLTLEQVQSILVTLFGLVTAVALTAIGPVGLVNLPYCYDADVHIGGYCLNVTAPNSVYPARPVNSVGEWMLIVFGCLNLLIVIPVVWWKVRAVRKWYCAPRIQRELNQEELMKLAHIYDDRAFVASLQGWKHVEIEELGASNVDSAIRLAGLRVQDWEWGKRGYMC